MKFGGVFVLDPHKDESPFDPRSGTVDAICSREPDSLGRPYSQTTLCRRHAPQVGWTSSHLTRLFLHLLQPLRLLV